MGYVAAEANHAKDKKLQKELDRLFAQMKVLQSAAVCPNPGKRSLSRPLAVMAAMKYLRLGPDAEEAQTDATPSAT